MRTTDPLANSLRPTGISIIGDMPWGTHFCHFYETKGDLLDTLVLFFKAGLENNEFCLWVVSQPLTVEEAKHALEKVVSDLTRHLAEGSLAILGHDEWYLHKGQCEPGRVIQSWCEKLNEALAKGHAGMRASGDTAWVHKDQWKVFCEYEKEFGALSANQRMLVLCTYPLNTSPAAHIFDVARLHQVAVARRHGRWEMVETPELKLAKAEIKRLNDELEQKVEERTKELAATNEALRAEIAERKLAEELVRQAEDRLRLVLDTTPALIHTGRPDGYLDYFNQRWLKYVGGRLEDLQGWAWMASIHPEDVEGMVNRWRAMLAGGEPFHYEARVRRADGEYRWMLHHKVPLRDEHGKIVKWHGSSIDIEDRKQAETQSRVLIDAIPHQIWSGPSDGTMDYCNERWRSYMGLEMEGARGDGWQTMLHPDDRVRVLKAWHESVVNGTPYEQEERRRAADGTYRWFLSRGVPQRDAEGRIVRWYGTNTDIEDRKQADEAVRESQQLLHLVLATLPVGVGVTDRAGNIFLANAASKRIWGDTIVSGSERWAQSKGFWHDSGKQIAPENWASMRTLSEGKTSLNELIDIETRDGQKKTIQNSSAPIRNAEGLIVGAVIVNEDVTERVHAEAALKNSHEQLRALTARLESLREEEATRIAREIHDELGQKLTGLKMDLRRAERKLEELESSSAVNPLLDTLVSATELTDEIIATVQEIAANLRPGVLDKLGLGAALHYEGRRFQERTGISCEVSLPETEPGFSTEVSTALFRIFQECLTNIARHAHATKVEAALKLEDGSVTLRVQDNGRGITEAEIANPESLGLLGMKERTALLGGELVFQRNTQGGTTVTVSIPESGTSVQTKEAV